ncbi:hypothetical protein GJAV_G00089740 [Gymnothorax javanicus]|nr:hypothetical protein GJAV_G00089740 [Gymnothorax javanicus]
MCPSESLPEPLCGGGGGGGGNGFSNREFAEEDAQAAGCPPENNEEETRRTNNFPKDVQLYNQPTGEDVPFPDEDQSTSDNPGSCSEDESFESASESDISKSSGPSPKVGGLSSRDTHRYVNNMAPVASERLSANTINWKPSLLLGWCDLTEGCCDVLASVLRSPHSELRDLELRDNGLQDSGVTALSAGLEDPDCKLQRLGLSGCRVTHTVWTMEERTGPNQDPGNTAVTSHWIQTQRTESCLCLRGTGV